MEITEVLPKLSPKQQDYYFHRVDGKGPSEAYLAAYDVNPDGAYIRQAAWKVENGPKVKQHLEHYRETVGRVICSREAHLHRLDELGREAQEKDKYGDAINAEVHRGKATGHYNHTQVHVTGDLNTLYEQIQSSQTPLMKTIEVSSVVSSDDSD